MVTKTFQDHGHMDFQEYALSNFETNSGNGDVALAAMPTRFWKRRVLKYQKNSRPTSKCRVTSMPSSHVVASQCWRWSHWIEVWDKGGCLYLDWLVAAGCRRTRGMPKERWALAPDSHSLKAIALRAPLVSHRRQFSLGIEDG